MTPNPRSCLFLPGTRLELLAKVGRWGPDVVVVDLEDAVAATSKEDARSALAEEPEGAHPVGVELIAEAGLVEQEGPERPGLLSCSGASARAPTVLRSVFHAAGEHASRWLPFLLIVVVVPSEDKDSARPGSLAGRCG